ncbi:MAG: TylF/MycF/NovP-related O-methyltransferase [bacterium]
MDIKKLIGKHQLISKQIRADELFVLLSELKNVVANQVQGDLVELGCYEGTSALFFTRLLNDLKSDKKLWLYDSFEGLPEKTSEDDSAAGVAFKGGELKASKARLAKNFVKAGLKIPEIKRAWFYELDPSDLPDQVCFAFLDGDFYESIVDSLKLVVPLIAKGGVILVDDYQNLALPGVAKAVNEYAERYDWKVQTQKSLAVIRM